uniref:Uncharacterized protein n=1 Tax=Arundo donax TaxID=35708 RepID=A0A0A9B6N1_ARUDO
MNRSRMILGVGVVRSLDWNWN